MCYSQEEQQYRDNLHRQIVLEVVKLNYNNSDFEVTLNKPYKIDLYDNVYVTGIDGETARLITSRSGGFLIDYPKLTTGDLSDLMEIVNKKRYYIGHPNEELSRRQVV
jgi:hypothetical protein